MDEGKQKNSGEKEEKDAGPSGEKKMRREGIGEKEGGREDGRKEDNGREKEGGKEGNVELEEKREMVEKMDEDSATKSATNEAARGGGGVGGGGGGSGNNNGGGGGNNGNGGGGGKRKKPRRRQRHRRGKHSHQQTHKWKPYDKLTWDERKKLEERETRRALRVRQERFAIGLPVAPYNTTQFLMEDHDCLKEPKLTPPHLVPKKKGPRERRCSAPGGSGDETGKEGPCPGGDQCTCPASDGGLESSEYEYDDEDMDEAFLAKEEEEFSQAYDTIHAESLHNMSKNQLVIEYMELEAKLEEMTKKLRRDESPWPMGPMLHSPRENENGPVFNYVNPPIRNERPSTSTEDEMALLREKVEALERENKTMKEEMRRLSSMNAQAASLSSSSSSSSSASFDDGGGGGGIQHV